MTSASSPNDMEFVNMAMKATRPDGKSVVPIWLAAEGDFVSI